MPLTITPRRAALVLLAVIALTAVYVVGATRSVGVPNDLEAHQDRRNRVGPAFDGPGDRGFGHHRGWQRNRLRHPGHGGDTIWVNGISLDPEEMGVLVSKARDKDWG